MNAPIERTNEGFWINKSLAWTIVIALMSGSLWVGLTVNEMRGQNNQRLQEIVTVREANAKLEVSLGSLEQRVRPLEIGLPELRADIRNMYDGIKRIEEALSDSKDGEP